MRGAVRRIAGVLAPVALVLATASQGRAAEGDIYVADPQAAGGKGAVFRIDPDSGAKAAVSAGVKFEDPTGIDFDDTVDGGIAVADPNAEGGSGAVFLVDPQTGAQRVVSSGGRFVNPVGIDATVGTFYDVADPDAAPPGGPPGFGDGNVFTVDPDTGNQSDADVDKVELPFVDPTGVGGSLPGYVADPNAGAGARGAILAFTEECAGPKCFFPIRSRRWSRRAGAYPTPSRWRSDLRICPGCSWRTGARSEGRERSSASRRGVARRRSRGAGAWSSPATWSTTPRPPRGPPARILVADRDAAGGSGAVIAVNPSTGAQTVLSKGGGFVDPSGIAVDIPFCFGGDENLTVIGTSGPDILRETPGIDDVVAALAGDDVVGGDPSESGEDVDFICGGDGDDVVHGGPGREFVFGGAGNDRVDGNGADDELNGNLGEDVLSGGGGRDQLLGGGTRFLDEIGLLDGDDKLAGKAKNDLLEGHEGDDRLKGGGGRDRLYGGVGKDDLNGGKGRDVCIGGPGRDKARGCEKKRKI